MPFFGFSFLGHRVLPLHRSCGLIAELISTDPDKLWMTLTTVTSVLTGHVAVLEC